MKITLINKVDNSATVVDLSDLNNGTSYLFDESGTMTEPLGNYNIKPMVSDSPSSFKSIQEVFGESKMKKLNIEFK